MAKAEGAAGRRRCMFPAARLGLAGPLRRGQAGGDAARFATPPLHGDAASFGKTQALIAIASDAPLAAFPSPKGDTAADFAKALTAEWGNAAASAAYFRFAR